MSHKKDVRILLLGDDGVGKTSLILALVSEEFPEEVPPRAEEITIPAEVTPEKVPTHIVDFSFTEQTEVELCEEIQLAHVICVLYAVDNQESVQRITEYWLPSIREVMKEEQCTKPVILVGNKADSPDRTCMDDILRVMAEYSEVETCVECSAKTLRNISEVFYYAQKAYLYPTAPLFIHEEKDLTEKAKKALNRIFKVCDTDGDGVLNDEELNVFQCRCFHAPLQQQALDDVKAVVVKSISDGLKGGGLTLKGFLFLHTLFIQRARIETTWTVLRKFGYDDDVQVSKEYLHPQLLVGVGCTTELSERGRDFLLEMFDKYDVDNDGCLSPGEMSELFSTCPLVPWAHPDIVTTVETDPRGWITRHGYMSMWTLTTYLDVTQTLEYLAYLGYCKDDDLQTSAIYVTRERHVDIEKKQTTRSVFRCRVFGASGVGKTTFLQGLINKSRKKQAALNRNSSQYTVGTVTVYGQHKYLIMQEMSATSETIKAQDLQCDVVCLMYDITNPYSFEYCAKLYETCVRDSGVPCLVVSAHCDLQPVLQQCAVQPDEFTARHRLPPLHSFSHTDSDHYHLYTKLATMAAFPNLRRLVHMLLTRPSPAWISEQWRTLRNKAMQGEPQALVTASVGFAATAVAVYAFFKFINKRPPQQNPFLFQ